MKHLLLIALSLTTIAASAEARQPEVACEIVERDPCPTHGPASYHCSHGIVYLTVCTVSQSVQTIGQAVKLKKEMELYLNGRWGY